MKNFTYILLFLISVTGFCQNEITENDKILSKLGEEIDVHFIYQYSSKDAGSDQRTFLIPVIKSSVRGVLGKYSSEELYLKTKDELSLEIFKDLFQNKSLSDKFIIEEFTIEHLEYPHILKMAQENGLLQFYEDLKNTNPTARKNALTELFNEGSKSSYYLILDHWSKETDNELKEFILEKITE